MSATMPVNDDQKNLVQQLAIGLRTNQVEHARALAAEHYEGNFSMAVRYLVDRGMASSGTHPIEKP